MNRTAAAAALVCAATISPVLARAAAPTVRLEPAEVAPGEPTTMVVETDGAAAPPHIPALPGLDVQPIGQQTQLTIVNGQRTDSTSYLYRVASDAQGDLVIDGITVDGARAAPVTLHVDVAASSAALGAAAAPAPRPSFEDAPSDDVREHEAARAFLRLRLGKRNVYAGERVPFTVQAYFRAGTGVTLSAAPKFSDDSLVVSGLEKEPKQVETTIDDERYLAVTWRGELTAAKDGRIAAEATLPTTLQYVEASAPMGPRRALRDLFAGSFPMSAMMRDPLFDALLNGSVMDLAEPGRVVSRDLTLRGKAKSLEVLPLPSEGRPADFQGAIGRFELQTALTRTDLTEGEPVDLKIELTGDGNFGRFALPALSSSADFRAYSAANGRVAGEAETERGALTSRQPIAALRSGVLEVPPVRFSYFDPALGTYVTESSDPIAVQVAPAAGGAAEQVAGSPHGAPVGDMEGPVVATLTRGGVPAWLFPTALACLLVSLFAAATLRFRSSASYANAEGALRAHVAVRRHRAAMRRAAAARDGAGVVRAGSDAVRAKLARAWHVPSTSITAHELAMRLPNAPRAIVELLELADEAEYAGRSPDVPAHFDLRTWTSELDRQIANLEASS